MLKKLKLHLVIAIVSLLNSFPSTATNDQEQDLSGWMRHIPNNRKISELAIPGTHDSGALHDGGACGYAKCQDLDLKEQLAIGIRFLDIRCRLIDNVLTIHHGQIYQELKFGHVLQTCIDFLKQNPNEFILMSVKEEHDQEETEDFKKTKEKLRSFEEIFRSKYVNGNENFWYINKYIPIVKDVRGKIVLLRRFNTKNNNTPLGIDLSYWLDNREFEEPNDDGITYNVQDKYDPSSIKEKYTEIVKHLRKTKDNDKLYINFLSGSNWAAFDLKGTFAFWEWDWPLTLTPKNAAKEINKRVLDYIKNNSSITLGIIAMDFCSSDLSQKIINSNIFDSKMLFSRTMKLSTKLDIFREIAGNPNATKNELGWAAFVGGNYLHYKDKEHKDKEHKAKKHYKIALKNGSKECGKLTRKWKKKNKKYEEVSKKRLIKNIDLVIDYLQRAN